MAWGSHLITLGLVAIVVLSATALAAILRPTP